MWTRLRLEVYGANTGEGEHVQLVVVEDTFGFCRAARATVETRCSTDGDLSSVASAWPNTLPLAARANAWRLERFQHLLPQLAELLRKIALFARRLASRARGESQTAPDAAQFLGARGRQAQPIAQIEDSSQHRAHRL